MSPRAGSSTGGRDRPKFASRNVIGVSGRLDPAEDSLAVWAERYLDLAVRGVRSAEVEAKIVRHLQRFGDWFADGFGHDRISAVTPREVTGWREHLAVTVVRALKDDRTATMAAATVNNHLAHLAAFFTWTAVHAPAELLTASAWTSPASRSFATPGSPPPAGDRARSARTRRREPPTTCPSRRFSPTDRRSRRAGELVVARLEDSPH
jgi:hypothetical protein